MIHKILKFVIGGVLTMMFLLLSCYLGNKFNEY